MITLALVQLGYPRPIPFNAVRAPSPHVAGGDMATLSKEAKQRTGS
jgi:hypothetical protein